MRRKTSSKNFSEKKNINCHATKRKKVNNQTANENVAIVNAIDEIFDVHRRFILIDEKNENFTAAVAANEADKTNEKKNK